MMIRRLWRWQVSTRDLEREFRAQISWMKNARVRTHVMRIRIIICTFIRRLRLRLLARFRPKGVRCDSSAALQLMAESSRYWAGRTKEESSAAFAVQQLSERCCRTLCFRKFRFGKQPRFSLPNRRGEIQQIPNHIGWLRSRHLPEGTFEFACHPGSDGTRFFRDAMRFICSVNSELRLLTGCRNCARQIVHKPAFG